MHTVNFYLLIYFLLNIFVENVMHFQDSLLNKKNSLYLKGIFCNIINVIHCIYYYYFLKGSICNQEYV